MSSLAEQLHSELRQHLSPIITEAMIQSTCSRLGTRSTQLNANNLPAILDSLERGLAIYLRPDEVRSVLSNLRRLLPRGTQGNAQPGPSTIEIAEESDIREARLAAVGLAKACGFNHPDATKVATVVSELARNILQYAGRGTIRIEPLSAPRRGIRVEARDQGPGIAELDRILDGSYRSPTGLGLGLKGSKQIMDTFDVVSRPGLGTSITAVKYG